VTVRLRDLGEDWYLGWAAPRGQVVRFRHLDEVRRMLARWRGREDVALLRKLLASREPSPSWLSDAAVLERCAFLLDAGRLRCWRVVPLRAWDVLSDDSTRAQEAPFARLPEEVKELREIVASVVGDYTVRGIATGVTTDWDQRAMETSVTTDWDTRAMETGVESDWDTRAIASEVESDWQWVESDPDEEAPGDAGAVEGDGGGLQ